MVASQEPLTMVSAPAIPTQLTQPAWPRSVRKQLPVARSHTLTVRSYDPLTSRPRASSSARHHTWTNQKDPPTHSQPHKRS
jgi:hypothetical protein